MSVPKQMCRALRVLPRCRLAIIFVACCWLTATASAGITAAVDRTTVPLGETVTLSLTVDGNLGGQPQLPVLPNFNVVGSGTSFEFDSTRGGARTTLTYQLSPTQIGEFTIPGFQFNLGGQVQTTQPIKINVVKPGDALVAPGAALPTAFVKLVISKTNLYVGEVAEVEVQVYTQQGRLTRYPDLPADSGFTIGKWLRPTESRVALSNMAYNFVSLKVPITIVKAGQIALGPATLPLLVPKGPPSFFDRNEREVRLAAEKVTLIAEPLPTANVPANFAGAVGQYSIAVSATPTNVAVGDPITARIQISGRGWLDALVVPSQPAWREFKIYPPTSRIEGGDPNNISGTKTFEQAVVPENHEIKELPSFSFTFFNPDQRAFQTVSTAPIPITVRPNAGSAAPLPRLAGVTNAPQTPPPDLIHIKPHLGNVAPAPSLITQPWFLAVQLVPPLVWGSLLMRRKFRERLSNNPRLRRQREVDRRVAEGLKELRDQAKANNSDAFFATMFRLLQERLGERLDVPAHSITEAVVEERLHPGGLPDDTCAALRELFQMCNLARYAPIKSSSELAAVIPKVERALDGIEEWRTATLTFRE